MKNSKTALLCSVAFTGLISVPAFAADLPARLSYKAAAPIASDPWTGFYVGANAGGAWGKSNANTAVPCTYTAEPPGYFCSTVDPGSDANAAAIAGSGTGSMSASGFTGGIQAGYNRQFDNYVLGLETDFGALGLKTSRTAVGTYPANTFAFNPGSTYNISSSSRTSWLYTFRGRAGVVVASNWLLYVTGGLAITDLKVSNTFSDNNSPTGAFGTGSSTVSKVGWVVGAGAEWALNNHWTVKAEYLYLNFGSVTATGIVSNAGAGPGYAHAIGTSSDLTASIARAGVNYKF